MKNIITASLLALFATSANAEDLTIDMLNKRDDGAKICLLYTSPSPRD